MTNIGDDLLELILVRIRSPVRLIRAAATCKPWRRVISGAGFLRRFGSLHSPLLLGHYYVRGQTFFVPNDDHASLDFLHSTPNRIGDHPELTDCRGGLLLFAPSISLLVVCDPWAGQYKTVSVPCTWVDCNTRCRLGLFLLPAEGVEVTGTKLQMSEFRVLHVHMDQKINGRLFVTVSVFCARRNYWHLSSSTDTEDVIAGTTAARVSLYAGSSPS
ncbi:hypothetical protein PR202_gb24050 [Eleusine coracana subsp. coracana]|uniref:F-box domain-containing protein n=1 Tax=Eleusine coracana subsp. coracana TaxID=191504 RepID=A0AAV5FLY4_ELECO|nr:hypothetical protein PR202_gb24050 [Eleusine coracana subsp. coracana]